MFQEMRLAAILHKPANGPKALPAQEVLDMATRDGARALGWADDIGSIEIGKKADLIALDLQQPENLVATFPGAKNTLSEQLAASIVYSTGPKHLKWTLVDGKVRFAHGKVRGIKSPLLVREVLWAQAQIARTLKAKAFGKSAGPKRSR